MAWRYDSERRRWENVGDVCARGARAAIRRGSKIPMTSREPCRACMDGCRRALIHLSWVGAIVQANTGASTGRNYRACPGGARRDGTARDRRCTKSMRPMSSIPRVDGWLAHTCSTRIDGFGFSLTAGMARPHASARGRLLPAGINEPVQAASRQGNGVAHGLWRACG